MNIINIDTSSDNGVSSFRITGSYKEITNNNRLLAFLRRVRATSRHEAFYIPFIEQRKGIGVIAVKNGLDNLLILFSVSWWI